MRGSDEKLCFSEKERSIVWKDNMKMIMNEDDLVMTWYVVWKVVQWKVQ